MHCNSPNTPALTPGNRLKIGFLRATHQTLMSSQSEKHMTEQTVCYKPAPMRHTQGQTLPL